MLSLGGVTTQEDTDSYVAKGDRGMSLTLTTKCFFVFSTINVKKDVVRVAKWNGACSYMHHFDCLHLFTFSCWNCKISKKTASMAGMTACILRCPSSPKGEITRQTQSDPMTP